MSNSDRDFWFPVKTYGWGWGLPVKWQGWLVLAAYFVLLFGGIAWFTARKSVLALPVYAAVVTTILVVIVYIKGERPAKWRWGGK